MIRPVGALRLAALAALLAAAWAGAARAATCPGYSQCPVVNYPAVVASDQDAVSIATGIDATEAAALADSANPNLSTADARALLGKLIAFDRRLSVKQNQACMSCHTGNAGFGGGISLLNGGAVTFPGSLPQRTGNRRPISLAYSGFAPTLGFDGVNFVGGNFWDGRATGQITGSPAGDQALAPFTGAVEMALPDPACVIRRIATGPYAALFGRVYGTTRLSIPWPANVDTVCGRLNSGAADQAPLALTAAARAKATETFTLVGRAVAAFETSAGVSPFSSKFDAFVKGKVSLTRQEASGQRLFNGRGGCNVCHASSGVRPLFTNFTYVNIGIPPNRLNPFFYENVADANGFVANPAGPSFVDPGLGGFLASAANARADWQALAPKFVGAFQTPSLRNVAARPRANFKRAYMHNGFFTDLTQVVKFYSTRDTLPRCETLPAAQVKIGDTCWPAPATTANLDTQNTGNLGLSATDISDIVAFLGTLTDGYVAP